MPILNGGPFHGIKIEQRGILQHRQHNKVWGMYFEDSLKTVTGGVMFNLPVQELILKSQYRQGFYSIYTLQMDGWSEFLEELPIRG